MAENVIQLPGAGERWITKDELADILGMSTRWIEKRMHDQDPMPFRRRGRAVRFRLSDVEAWELRRAS